MQEFERALNEDLSEVQVPISNSTDQKDWPALSSLAALSRLARRPPTSALGKLSGALQAFSVSRIIGLTWKPKANHLYMDVSIG
eukprot:symbB.v1.2.009240.t1/scaffold583.1/size184467/12